MRSTRSRASWSASSMIALVVASMLQTFVTRRPRIEACGTRVHTSPVALATSIAATRSTISSCSSQSISTGSLATAHLPTLART